MAIWFVHLLCGESWVRALVRCTNPLLALHAVIREGLKLCSLTV